MFDFLFLRATLSHNMKVHLNYFTNFCNFALRQCRFSGITPLNRIKITFMRPFYKIHNMNNLLISCAFYCFVKLFASFFTSFFVFFFDRFSFYLIHISVINTSSSIYYRRLSFSYLRNWPFLYFQCIFY